MAAGALARSGRSRVRDGASRLGAGRALRLAAGVLVAATALLPREAGTLAVLALVIGLGVPHGALDGEVARGVLRPRLGRCWFPAFAVPYLALAGLVLFAWRTAPLATLAGFLALSVLHFGEEDAGEQGGPLEVLVRGGLPIAAPALLQPGAVAQVFATVSATPLPTLPPWLVAGAWLWAGALALLLATALPARRGPVLAETVLLLAASAILPPLAAFALYFVCLHAPRHVAALVADPRRAPRVRDAGSALTRALPITALTLALGALLWPTYSGAPPERLLALTLQGLAALTLPHVVLDRIATARSRSCG